MATPPASVLALKLFEKTKTLEQNNNGSRIYCPVIFIGGHTTLKAKTSYRLTEIKTHLDELDRNLIQDNPFRPRDDRGQSGPLLDICYIKNPPLLHWSKEDADKVHTLVLFEARFCKDLMENPHPNIARYFGGKQADPYITCLYFERYREDLHNRVSDKGMEGLSVGTILRGIRQGIEYILGLGYHNYICPGNIMLRSDCASVIIDFDSCQAKAGKPYLSDFIAKLSKPENDFYGLKQIEKGLRRYCAR